MLRPVYFVMTMMLNETPSAQGISETFSPQVLVTQRVFDFDKMPKVELGEYIEYAGEVECASCGYGWTGLMKK